MLSAATAFFAQTLALLVIFAGLSAQSSAQEIPASQSDSGRKLCEIKGSITDEISGQGLRKAFVRLTGNGVLYAAVSDANGKYAIEGVKPGSYHLEAERQGYIDSQSETASGVELKLNLAPGQILTDVQIKLTPQAVISGRVVDEDGDVWTHAQVNLLRSEWAHGSQKIRSFSGGELNDQGEFRIAQIPPGKYYLSAEPSAEWESHNHTTLNEAGTAPPQRQPTWYPSSLDSAGATPISISAGNQVSGLEIRLRRGGVHQVRGTLLGIENIPEAEKIGPFASRRISIEETSAVAMNEKFGVIHSDGSFEIAAVPSGSYEIHVRQGFRPVNLATAKVQVDDRDLNDVSIQLVPPRPLKGTIQIEEEGSLKASGLPIQLDPLVPMWSPSTVSHPDGSFDFPIVGSERYRVIVGEYSNSGFYLKQIRYGDVISNDGTVSLTGESGNLVLLLSTRGARLTGKLNVTAAEVSRTTQVILVPTAALGEPRLAVFDQNGTFSFAQLAPGAYKLFAFYGAPNGAWENPEFIKEFSAVAVDLQLTEGDQKNVDVSPIGKSAVDVALKKLGLE